MKIHNCIFLQKDKTVKANCIIGIFLETIYQKGGTYASTLHRVYSDWIMMKRNAKLLIQVSFNHTLPGIYMILTDMNLLGDIPSPTNTTEDNTDCTLPSYRPYLTSILMTLRSQRNYKTSCMLPEVSNPKSNHTTIIPISIQETIDIK